MDPTERLYCLILISREVKKIDKLIEDIEQAIEEGAVLDSEYYSLIGREKYTIPILFAIEINAPIKVIYTLKKHWWNDINNARTIHLCDECDIWGQDGWLIAKGGIKLILNNEYECRNSDSEENEHYFNDLFSLFEVEFINDPILRHRFINKHIIG